VVDLLPKLLAGQSWIWNSYMELLKHRGAINQCKQQFRKAMQKHNSNTSLFDLVKMIKTSVEGKKITRFKP
jgi:hypothetical protein